jgi:hypothetical protein
MRYQTSRPTDHSRTRIILLLGGLVTGCLSIICVGCLIVLFAVYSGARLPTITNGLSLNSRPWDLYLIKTSANDSPEPGWKDVSIDLAVENMSPNPAWFPLSPYMTLTDKGGYTRDVVLVHPIGYGRDERDRIFGFMLWPHFRAVITLKSRIPQNQSSAALDIGLSDASEYKVDLMKPPANIKTPFEGPPVGWQPRQLGDATVVQNVSRVVLTDVSLVDNDPKTTAERGGVVLALFINAENLGGENAYAKDYLSRIYAFDDSGRLGDKVYDECMTNTNSCETAPGSTSEVRTDILFDPKSKSSQVFWIGICLSSDASPLSRSRKANSYANFPEPGACSIYECRPSAH